MTASDFITPSPACHQAQATVLFVNEEPNILKSLRRFFRSEGYVAYFAESRAKRLALLNQTPIIDSARAARAFSRIIEMRPGIKSVHANYIAENAHAVAKKIKIPEVDLIKRLNEIE